MSIPIHRLPLIIPQFKRIPQHLITGNRARRTQNFVITSREKVDRDTPETTHVDWCYEVGRWTEVGGYVADGTHVHEEGFESHGYAAEKALDLVVGRFVEVAVVPEAAEDEGGAVTGNIVAKLLRFCWIKS